MASKAQGRSGWREVSPKPFTPAARISPDLQARIGLQLRAMYDQVRAEPVPEHILDLLKRLDQPGTPINARPA